MAKKITNIGLVKAIFVSAINPINTNVIWLDTVENLHKAYNTSTNQWEPLVEMVQIDNATIKKDGEGKLYVDAATLPGYTLSNGSVTLLKMANVASGTVFYRKAAGSGPPEVQTLAQLKSDLGLTGTNSGDQNLSGFALKSYTINNHLLNGDILLTPSDIGSPAGSGTSVGINTGDETEASILAKLQVADVISIEDLEAILSFYVLKEANKSLISDSEIVRLSSVKQQTYTFTLPSAPLGSVPTRCAGTIARDPGTEDWILQADSNPIDLLITHNLNRKLVTVSVVAITNEGERVLVGNQAWSGLIAPSTDPLNKIRIESLATMEFPIRIHVTLS